MAVTSVKEIWKARQFQSRLSEGHSTATRAFRMITDNRADDAVRIQAWSDPSGNQLPQDGDRHPSNSAMYVSDRTIAQIEESPTIWLATIRYSDKVTDNFGENPETDKPTLQITTVEEQVDLTRDRHGNSYSNTIGEFFHGAKKPEHYWRMTVGMNVLQNNWSRYFLDSPNTVNSKGFTVEGVAIPKGWARMASMNISKELLRGIFHYYNVKISILIRRNGWERSEMNRGLRARTSAEFGGPDVIMPILDEHSQRLTRPVLLSEDGWPLTKNIGSDSSPRYYPPFEIRFEIFDEYDFTQIPHFQGG